jgi:hypothetical protein
VEEVGKSVVQNAELPSWTVKVREGSSLIGIDPSPAANITVVEKVYARIELGVFSMADGRYDDALLSDAAVKHLKVLAEMGDTHRKNGSLVKLWVQRRPAILGADIAATIREDWRSAYNDFGTIEGKLEAIQDKSTLQLRIRDPLLNVTVNCYVSEDLLPSAFKSFRKRIEASGIIHYRKNGNPISINAERIDELPDDAVLPSIRDVRGILSTH